MGVWACGCVGVWVSQRKLDKQYACWPLQCRDQRTEQPPPPQKLFSDPRFVKRTAIFTYYAFL